MRSSGPYIQLSSDKAATCAFMLARRASMTSVDTGSVSQASGNGTHVLLRTFGLRGRAAVADLVVLDDFGQLVSLPCRSVSVL